jgi:lipid-A-disaccharide synthase
MRYFIIAGEQSGDLHGSNLIRGLAEADKNPEIFCWGGDLMEAAGAKLLVHYRSTAFMGFVSVLKNLGTIKKNIALCKQQILELKPDVVIFIDYPGFNLRIAEFAKGSGFRTFYYISPKFWAWNEGRVKKVQKFIDRMFIIFPFEIDFYKKHGIAVQYYGNPLVDETEKRLASMPPESEIFKSFGMDPQPVIALLAGSRRHEVEMVLPQMIKLVKQFPEYKFILAGVKNIPEAFNRKILGNDDVKLITDKTYEILHVAEAALLGAPQVVCYKAGFIEALIAWAVIRVKYISLVNLIMNEEVIRELVQYDLTAKSLIAELRAILPGGEKRDQIISDYETLKLKLGPSGASGRIAWEMVMELRKKRKREGE